MTSITAPSHPRSVPGRRVQLGLALVLGLAIGSSAALAVADRADPPLIAAATSTGPTTDASTQYREWYLRDGTPGPGSLAGSTTAGEQYQAWYTRGGAGR